MPATLYMQEPRRTLLDFDRITPENERYFCDGVIFYKLAKQDRLWHITLTEFVDTAGFFSFCRIRAWAAVDTSDRQRLEREMLATGTTFCAACAEEFVIAFDELKRQGYLGAQVQNVGT